jgi:hypothetical protein
MTGREFIVELERQGFAIKRRSKSFVWISRGEQMLMLDEEATVPDKMLITVLGARTKPPPSARRSLRPSMTPSRPSARPASSSLRPSGRPSRTS